MVDGEKRIIIAIISSLKTVSKFGYDLGSRRSTRTCILSAADRRSSEDRRRRIYVISMEDSEGPCGEELWHLFAYEQRGIHLNRKAGVVDRSMRHTAFEIVFSCVLPVSRELHFSRPLPVHDRRGNRQVNVNFIVHASHSLTLRNNVKARAHVSI